MKFKFRIWDKKYNMFDCNESPDLFISTDGEVYEKDERSYAMQTWIEYEKADHYVINMYTGLKDKNGKEIYEGDILKSPSSYNRVFWNEDCWSFEVMKKHSKGGWIVGYINKGLAVSAQYSEVVGNVFENKEFLEESQ